MSKLRLLFLVLSLYQMFARADYTIDDSNSSVLKFSETSPGSVWRPFGPNTGQALQLQLPNGTMQSVDATQCYDGTYTYAACSASDNCVVQFSFTGSGITIYVLQAGAHGISASLSIDSGAATTATLDAPPPPQYYAPHVTLFNVQDIPSGTHTAVMKVLDWNGGSSGVMVDYIDVTQAQVSGSSISPSPSLSSTTSSIPGQFPSTTPAPSSSDSQTVSQQLSSTGTQTNSVASTFSFQSSGAAAVPSSTSRSGAGSALASSTTHVPAVAGGVVGGVVGLLALLGMAFFCLRRYRRLQGLGERSSTLLPPEAGFTDIGAVGEDPFASSSVLTMSRPSAASHPLQSWTDSESGCALSSVTPRDASSA